MSSDPNIFNVIREAGYVLLHHPYVSFKTSVERFLREASLDPEVLAIKMTLYRTSSDTKAIEYLIDAAQNGKQVAVVVELKARFDEHANIRWASRLEEAGIHVTYGVVGLKTHCKAILVVRHEHDHMPSLRAHRNGQLPRRNGAPVHRSGPLDLGPRDRGGPDRALQLPDHRLQAPARLQEAPAFTEDLPHRSAGEDRARDLEAFVQVTGTDPDQDERPGGPGHHPRALPRLPGRSPTWTWIVRDTCRLRPGVPGLSENVRVISIVGRFLEHARITYFRNGGDEEYTIGSADLMRRNLNSRVEIMAPIEDPGLQKELRRILDLQLADRRDAWEMQPDGSYVQLSSKRDSKGSQERLIEHYAKQLKKVTRLKRRKPRGLNRRSQ